MNAQELAALLAYSTAMAFTPGPNTTLASALAANGGLRHAMRFVLAVPLGWSALLLLCSFGLGAVVTAEPAVRTPLVIAGSCAMLWMAWQLAQRSELGDAAPSQLAITFWQGVALQFVNVKAWLAALVISATWIAVDGELGVRLAIVLPLMVAFGFASNFSYALVGALLRRWLAHGRRLLWFNRVMAGVLAATALWLLGA
jgi:threonine/homoserine/homoserine lactone efflux protein